MTNKLKLLKLKSDALSLKELYSNYLSVDSQIAAIHIKSVVALILFIGLFFGGRFVSNYFAIEGINAFLLFAYIIFAIPLFAWYLGLNFISRIPDLKEYNKFANNNINRLDLFIEKLDQGVVLTYKVEEEFQGFNTINDKEFEKIKNKYNPIKKIDFAEEQKLIRIKLLEVESDMIQIDDGESELAGRINRA